VKNVGARKRSEKKRADSAVSGPPKVVEKEETKSHKDKMTKTEMKKDDHAKENSSSRDRVELDTQRREDPETEEEGKANGNNDSER
jgi:hypothetical protein